MNWISLVSLFMFLVHGLELLSSLCYDISRMIGRKDHYYLLIRTDYVKSRMDLRRLFLVSLQKDIDCHGINSLQQDMAELLWKL
jgi:hypothetical protein